MKKVCPRCGQAFECRRDEIALCQCASVGLNAEQRASVRAAYADCLCRDCLLDIKSGGCISLEFFLPKKK